MDGKSEEVGLPHLMPKGSSGKEVVTGGQELSFRPEMQRELLSTASSF